MRVMLFLHSMPPYRYTGGELMTLELAASLAARGHTVEAFVDHAIGSGIDYKGITVHGSGYLRSDIAHTFDLFITHPEIRTDITYYTVDMPYVAIVHNTSTNTMRSLDRQPPDLTIVNSQWTMDHVPESCHVKGVELINPPTTITPIDGPHYYVTIINYSVDKGGDVFAHVARAMPHVQFMAVCGGHGVQKAGDFPSNVHLMDATSDMAWVYSETKVLLFPTRIESYGKVAAEAMACGVPAIVSDIPALHEVCEGSAMFVDPLDPAAWVAALTTMLQDDTLATYGQKAALRGTGLVAKALTDLDRWESLLLETVGHDD